MSPVRRHSLTALCIILVLTVFQMKVLKRGAAAEE